MTHGSFCLTLVAFHYQISIGSLLWHLLNSHLSSPWILECQNSRFPVILGLALLDSSRVLKGAATYHTHSKPGSEGYPSWMPVLLQQVSLCNLHGWYGKSNCRPSRSLQSWEGKLESDLPESNMKICHKVSFLNFDLIRSTFIRQKGEEVLGIWNNNYFWIKNIWNYIKNEMILKNVILFP